MTIIKEDVLRKSENVLDVSMCVDELHSLNAREMKKLLKEQNILLRMNPGKGARLPVDMERLSACLPLHLIAYTMSRTYLPRLRYLLRGVRLLHSLGDLAANHPKLEQVLLQEVNTREQIMDFAIFLLLILADSGQVYMETRLGSIFTLFHSTLVACTLHLFTTFVAPDWQDVARVLLVHPKVDVFMDAAFDAVRRAIGLLQTKVRTLNHKLLKSKMTFPAAERVAQTIVQQCEASLQVLQSLCEVQDFRDKILKHEELCKNGGILRLVLTASKLQLPSSFQGSKSLVAATSRLKAKALAILLKFCETESVSFLDEIASNPRSMHLAELIAGEVLGFVKGALLGKPVKLGFSDDEKNPMGSLCISSLRLVDAFSDDSNFRTIVIERIAPDLARLLAMEPNDFRSRWCGGPLALDSAKGEADALVVYDPFQAAGAALVSFKMPFASAMATLDVAGHAVEEPRTGCSLSVKQIPSHKYAQEQSTLLVKIFANLHCFNPEVCAADEKDRFLQRFLHYLFVGPLSPKGHGFFFTKEQTAARICGNLHVLLDHVASFSLEDVNDDDIQLASQFSASLHAILCVSHSSFELSEDKHPVIAYVQDAHCKRLQKLLDKQTESERWRRIQQRAPEVLRRELVASGAHPADVVNPGKVADHVKDSFVSNNLFEEGSTIFNSRLLPKDGTNVDRAPDETEMLREKRVVEELEAGSAKKPVQIDVEEEDYNDDDNCEDALRTEDKKEESIHSVKSQGHNDFDDVNEESEDKHPKKRQRRIMNEKQIAMMEAALKDEPDMQRFPKLIRQWTDTLNQIGPEIAHNQLKNWLNNRKARLARIARETRSEGDSTPALEKARKTRSTACQGSGHHSETAGSSPDSPEGFSDHSRETKRVLKSGKGICILKCKSGGEDDMDYACSNDLDLLKDTLSKFSIGQAVSVRDDVGNEIAIGMIHQLDGLWQGQRLHEQGLCLVEIIKLHVDNSTKLPFPSELMGSTFEEVENLLGEIRVAWKIDNIEPVLSDNTS